MALYATFPSATTRNDAGNAILGPLFRKPTSQVISMRRHARWMVLAFALNPRSSRAASVEGSDECPKSADVDAALSQLLRAKADRPVSAEVTVRDQGASWSVQVADRSATYSDPARDCSERTRIAAVFAALALEPPELEESVPEASVALPKPQPLSPARGLHGFDIAPEFLLAPGTGGRNTALTWGGALRWIVAGDRYGMAVGLGAGYPAVVKVPGYEASLGRVLLDTSGHVRWHSGSVEFGMEVGPYGGLVLARGRGLYADAASTHLDVGGRAGLRIAATGRRFSPFLAFQAEVSARRFSLVVDPSGNVGNAPRVWLGLMAGGAISFENAR
jgi:hypothetical protein